MPSPRAPANSAPAAFSPSASTRLENLRWESGRARFDAAGTAVDLTAADHPEALAAFQAFYHEALEAYSAGVRVEKDPPAAAPGAPEPAPRDWFGQRRSLFARVLARLTGKSLPAPAAQAAPKAAAAVGQAAQPAEAEPEKGKEKSPSPAPPAAAAPARKTKTPAATSAALAEKEGARPALLLRAAFADQHGVHVIWSEPGEGGKSRETELLYRFDSPVAERLQACYGNLAALGYDVVDLQVWRKAPAPEAQAQAAAAKGPAPRPAAAAAGAAPAAGGSAPAKSEPALVMRLHPGAADSPGRAIVSPVEDERNLQVLTAPERLVEALHAAADSRHEPHERLTYLRCALNRGALKVVAVGLGEHPTQPRAPARWEGIGPWWEAAKKSAALAPSAAAAATPAPSPARRGGAEPELF